MKILLFLALVTTCFASYRHHRSHSHHRHRQTLNEQQHQPKIWALLVAGSNGWGNYRHQADMCHSYQILRKHGVPEERIVTMMYDDIAHNEQNPYPGKIYNRPEGPDVYAGVVKDYTGEDVNPTNFLKILQGDENAMANTGSGKVIKSGPNDHVFVYFTDHGGTNIIGFPEDVLHNVDLIKALKSMHADKKFAQLTFYLEACESGSMFRHHLPNNINVYAITAANYHESSWGYYCKNDMHLPCLGDLFSISWMQDSDKEDLLTETLMAQYLIVKERTNLSHVEHFGNLTIAQEMVANFQGFVKPKKTENFVEFGDDDKSAWSSREIPLKSLELQKERASTVSEREQLDKQIHRLHQKRHYLERKMLKLVEGLIHDSVNRRRIIKGPWEYHDQLECHKTVTQVFNRICFPFSQNPYALKYVYILANLCQEGIDPEEIIYEMQNVCVDITLPFGGVE